MCAPGWKLEIESLLCGDKFQRAVLHAEVDTLREVLDEPYVKDLMDETYLAVGIRALHWGDLDAGSIRVTAFKGINSMEEFTQRYGIVYEVSCYYCARSR